MDKCRSSTKLGADYSQRPRIDTPFYVLGATDAYEQMVSPASGYCSSELFFGVGVGTKGALLSVVS